MSLFRTLVSHPLHCDLASLAAAGSPQPHAAPDGDRFVAGDRTS